MTGGTPPASHAFGSPVQTGDQYAQSVREARAAWEACVEARGGLEALAVGGQQVAAALSHCGVGCPAHRARLWAAWCVGDAADPEQAYSAASELQTGSDAEQIELDVLRTAPGHPWLANPDGAAVPSLRHLLLALSAHQPYVQGQNFAAAFALFNLLPEDVSADVADPHAVRRACEATEALAFVVLRCLLQSRLAGLFYSPRMADLRADLATASARFRARSGATGARVTAALAEWHLDVGALLPKAILCAFVGSAPDDAVLRLWDVLLCSPAEQARPMCVHAAEALLHCAAAAIEAGGLSDTQELIGALRSAGRHVTDVTALCRAAGAAVANPMDAALPPAMCSARRRASLTPPPSSSRVLRSADVNQPASTTAGKRRRSPQEAGPPFHMLDVFHGTANALWQPVSTALRTIGVGLPPPPSSVKRARTTARAPAGALTGHERASVDAEDWPASGAAASPSSWLCATPCRGAAHGAEEASLELSALKSRRPTPVRHMR